MLVIVLAAVVAVIVLSRSRGAFFALLLISIALTVTSRWLPATVGPSRWRSTSVAWWTAIVVGAGAVLFTPNALNWKTADFVSSARRIADYQNGTGRGRVIQATTSFRMFQRNWATGVGAGNWSVRYPEYAQVDDPSVNLGAYYPGPQVPRNDVLALLAESGVVGGGLGVAFLLLLGKRTRALVRDSMLSNRSAGLTIAGMLLAVALLGLFDSVLRVAPTATIIALLIGVALGDGERDQLPGLAGRAGAFRFLWIGSVGSLIVLSFALARGAAQDVSAMKIVNSFTSVADLERAVRVAPNNVEARAMLSFVLVSAGRCDLAEAHVQRAAALQPSSLLIKGFQEKCGISQQQSTRSP